MTGRSFATCLGRAELSLPYEMGITWLVHPETLAYARETTALAASRAGRIGKHRVPGLMVAYARLAPTAPAAIPGMFTRRVWYVLPCDPYTPEIVDPRRIRSGHWHPIEAADPVSVRPGYPSPCPCGTRAEASRCQGFDVKEAGPASGASS